MADDQKPKTMDINDLVRELSKSSTSPVAPTAPPQPARPPFPTPKPLTSPPAGGSMAGSPIPHSSSPKPLEMPKPQFNAPSQSFNQPKPATPPSPSTPLPVPVVKEYQSSIRTMNEDVSRLKQGQKPAGIDVPRKVEPVVPVAPQPLPSKPVAPSPQFKAPSVSLGETKKTAPMAPTNIPRPPLAPKTEPKPQIYVPQEGQGGSNRDKLFIGIGVVAILAGFAYWFFVLRSPAREIVQETPTLTPTIIATPIQNLNSIFSGINTENVSVKNPALDLNNAIGTLAINGGEFKNLNVTSESNSQTSLGLLDFLSKTNQQLTDNIGTDNKVLLYGQKELFDSKGQLKTNTVVEKRLVFLNEIKDAVVQARVNANWEASMNEDFKSIFQFDPKKQQSNDFADNSYRGVAIRYKNFKYADRSIDYAVVPGSNGKSYLIIAGSREALYAAIDKLKGF